LLLRGQGAAAVAPRIEWSMEASAEASFRAAGDGLQVPAASSWRGRSIGELADNGQPAGFGGPLFSPCLARRDHAVASLSTWFTGGCEFQWNVPPRLGVVPNGLTARLLDSRARLCRGPMSSDLDQMAWLLISLSAQSSSLSVAACRPAAIRTCSGRFYLHLKQMDSCGDGSRGSPPSSRFGGMHHILGVKPLSSHYRSAYVRVLMRAPKVVLCSRCVTGDWLIVFKPRGETSKYRVTALGHTQTHSQQGVRCCSHGYGACEARERLRVHCRLPLPGTGARKPAKPSGRPERARKVQCSCSEARNT
jgi:hypothetical protein